MVTTFFQGAKAPGSESLGSGEANAPKTRRRTSTLSDFSPILLLLLFSGWWFQHVFKNSSQLESV
jgi:hypothetical protein